MDNLKNKKLLINNERYKTVDKSLIKLEWLQPFEFKRIECFYLN